MRVSLPWWAGLWCFWMLLQGSPSLGSALLGVLVAWLIARWLAPEASGGARLRVLPLLRLLGRVAWDIVASNLAMISMVLLRSNRLRPRWVEVSLDLPDDPRRVVLAAIVSLTPGTLSVDLDAESRCLLVHALDCGDEDALASTIKSRYESLLLEVFA
ncbi:Na+/H+ antiporter subunit E [Niveibacterium umoris]|uniref:Multicomponent K+:H+ antiporter subunit E n=1 Tax=Niveibacterium umoris TaxID=1193620 RepID=A0A840BND0_9RHOO|nr:Na+/H+ antiporter subunit E [Niveibacterium umoris]MBB4012346.1 multicomponent K+:H+ antiporter subunit E [Niveibacterium umoris]